LLALLPVIHPLALGRIAVPALHGLSADQQYGRQAQQATESRRAWPDGALVLGHGECRFRFGDRRGSARANGRERTAQGDGKDWTAKIGSAALSLREQGN